MKVVQSFDGLDLTVLIALCVLGGLAWLIDLHGRRDADEETELWRGDGT